MGMSCSIFAKYWNSNTTQSASAAGRAAPPLVAHVSVALSEDRNSILLAGHRLLDFYAKIPFYANMFSNAGFPLTSDQAIPDTLVDNLVISGNESNTVGAIHRPFVSRSR